MNASAVSLFQAFFPDLDAELAEFILREASVYAANAEYKLHVEPTATVDVDGEDRTIGDLREYLDAPAGMSDAELLLSVPELSASKQAREQTAVTPAEAELFLDLTHLS